MTTTIRTRCNIVLQCPVSLKCEMKFIFLFQRMLIVAEFPKARNQPSDRYKVKQNLTFCLNCFYRDTVQYLQRYGCLTAIGFW